MFFVPRLPEDRSGPRLSQIANSDGEPLRSYSPFPLLAGHDPQDASRGLGTIRCFAQRATTSGTGWETAQISPAWAPPPRAQRLITTMDDGARVLGTIEIVPKAVTLSVNSERRAERGRALLGPSCAASCGPFIERQELEQAVAERQDKPKPASRLSRARGRARHRSAESRGALPADARCASAPARKCQPTASRGHATPTREGGAAEDAGEQRRALSGQRPNGGLQPRWMGRNSGSSGCGAEGSAIIVAGLHGVTEFGGNWTWNT